MIKKVSDYTIIPGGRYVTDGKFSGEEFRNTVLKPLLEEAIEKKEKLTIDLDDTYGYPSSFLEEAFGGLAREFTSELVLKTIELVSEDDPFEIERIVKYVKEAQLD